MELQAGGHSPSLGSGGVTRDSSRATGMSSTDTAASDQEETAVGREWSSERSEKRRAQATGAGAWSLQMCDITRFQEREFCAQNQG